MLPTIEELEDSGDRRINFPVGNKVCYWQDFSFYEGLPSDVTFFVDPKPLKPGYMILRGRGYGVRGDYGDGALFRETDQFP
jgi:hypothetical protein